MYLHQNSSMRFQLNMSAMVQIVLFVQDKILKKSKKLCNFFIYFNNLNSTLTFNFEAICN